ncbi:TerC family protein [Candidatus Poribacteria bacterium]|nr:TerC family protein [Candidatus Poribacteria bacterium]
MSNTVLLWIAFNLFVLAMLALDLGVFHRKEHTVSIKEALGWCAVWVSLAISFNVGIYFWRGHEKALEFLTGYLIEYSLSVDNIFVFLLIFSYFSVRPEYQHRALFWGILGALIMRATLIVIGATLISKFHWVIYLFGGFLILTGIRMAFQKEEGVHPETNPIVRLFRRFMPVTADYHHSKFFVKVDGRRFATPLAIVLLVIETTDLVFALDSIPAIFGVTHDSFIVYTSNVFAILGLRSLYFALAGLMGLFHYLKIGLSVVLVFIGIKMLLPIFHIEIPIQIALGVIAGILSVSVIASMVRLRKGDIK